MAQNSELGTHDRRTSSSPLNGGATGPAAARRRDPVPLLSPLPPRDDRTLEATGSGPRPPSPAFDATIAADPTTPPTSPERLAMLAAQLPSVARDAYAMGPEVAKGGIGRVVRARDQRLDRPVAIKELLVWNERQEQRFVREALLTARLQHPAIVPIYEAGRWPDGEPFYAMKLVSGRSLADLIAERGSLAERLSLLPHVLAAAQAIAYAHSKRIIHRDLKPANVLVGEFGETVVIDWGLAKDLAEEEPASADGPAQASGEGLTLQGAVVGTPSYMPPEQAAGRPVDERADVYALGAMLYHLLAAVPPYHDAPWEKLLATIAEKPPRRIEKLAPQISDELGAIVNKAMARAPDERYRTAKELADDLERFQTGRIVAAHTYSAGQLLRRYWWRNRSALSVAAAAIALVTLVVIVAFVKTDRDRRFAEQKEAEAIEASRAAEAARRDAEDAGQQATARADELTLLQAEGALQRDPNRALAWLKTLSASATDAAEVRRIASDARAHGLSRAFRGHTAHINRLALSRDGERFATASDDKTVRVWDVASGRSLVLSGHTDEGWNVGFLPGDEKVATISKDGTLRLWDARTGKELEKVVLPSAARQLQTREDGAVVGTPRSDGVPWIWRPGAPDVQVLTPPGEEPYWSIFSEDGKRLLVQRKDGEAYVLDVDGGGKRAIPRSPSGNAAWSLSQDGRVAARSARGSIEVWDLTRMTSWKMDTPLAASIDPPVLARDGRLLAAASSDGILVHETQSGKLRRRLTGYAGPLVAMHFSPDSRLLVTGSFDRTVRSWDIATGQSAVHEGFEGAPSAIEVLPDGSLLAVSTIGEARLFEPGSAGKIVREHGASLTGVAVSADGRVASLDQKGDLTIDSLDGKEIARHTVPAAAGVRLETSPDRTSFAGAPLEWRSGFNGRIQTENAPPGALLLGTFDAAAPRRIEMGAPVQAMEWLPDGGAVLLALRDGSVRRVDRAGAVVEIDRFGGAATALAVSADGTWVAAGGEDGTVRLTELATGQHRELGRHGDVVLSAAFSPDGRWLATGCNDHTARVWRLDDGTVRSFDEGGHGVDQLVFSADGKVLFLRSGGEAQLRRMVVETGEALAPLTGHAGPLLSFQVSGDGRRILTSGLDGTVRILDVATGRGRTLAGHSGPALGVFSADGKAAVTIGLDGFVRVWPDDLPETMPELRAWIEAATSDRIEGR